jgi:hypothetical protein
MAAGKSDLVLCARRTSLTLCRAKRHGSGRTRQVRDYSIALVSALCALPRPDQDRITGQCSGRGELVDRLDSEGDLARRSAELACPVQRQLDLPACCNYERFPREGPLGQLNDAQQGNVIAAELIAAGAASWPLDPQPLRAQPQPWGIGDLPPLRHPNCKRSRSPRKAQTCIAPERWY